MAGAITAVAAWTAGADGAVADAGGCVRAPSIAGDPPRRQAADSILCLVNRERARRGSRAVRASPELARSAHAHSRDMVARSYFSHVGPRGLTLRRRVARTGYLSRRRGAKVGETIAWGAQRRATPARLVAALLASPAHRRVLLDRRYRDLGVGLVPAAPFAGVADDAATLTLDFGRR